MTLEVAYGTCLDCMNLGRCSLAHRQSEEGGPESVLQLCCERHKRCHPTMVLSRKDALEITGLLALRGLIESHTTKEDMIVTRTEREEELKALGRMELRGEAIKASMTHKESLKAHSDDMLACILDSEYPDEEAKPPKKPAAKKPTTRKPAAKKPDKKAPAAPAGDGTDLEAIEALMADQLTPIGEVLDSHSVGLQETQDLVVGVVKVLHSFLCLNLEPDVADEVVQEAGLGELLEDGDPSED